MVNLYEETPQMSSVGNTGSINEAAIIFISIGSVLVLLCVASIIYGLRRRRHILGLVGGGSLAAEENVHNPTDFMNTLASWDRCNPIDEILEKRRRSVWTLEIFENYGSSHSDS